MLVGVFSRKWGNAWGLHCPAVMKDRKALRHKLLELDYLASQVAITDEHVTDPLTCMTLFDLGCLDPAMSDTCARLKKVLDSNKFDAVPLEVMRHALGVSVKKRAPRVAHLQVPAREMLRANHPPRSPVAG